MKKFFEKLLKNLSLVPKLQVAVKKNKDALIEWWRILSNDQLPKRNCLSFLLGFLFVYICVCVCVMCVRFFCVCVIQFVLNLSRMCWRVFVFVCRKKAAFFVQTVQVIFSMLKSCFRILPAVSLTEINGFCATLRGMLEHTVLHTDSHEPSRPICS